MNGSTQETRKEIPNQLQRVSLASSLNITGIIGDVKIDKLDILYVINNE